MESRAHHLHYLQRYVDVDHWRPYITTRYPEEIQSGDAREFEYEILGQDAGPRPIPAFPVGNLDELDMPRKLIIF